MILWEETETSDIDGTIKLTLLILKRNDTLKGDGNAYLSANGKASNN